MPTIATDSIPLNSPLPVFSLPDVVKGISVSDQDVKKTPALLVVFLCRHCPYVIHIREELLSLAQDYQSKGATFIGISSNDPIQFPEDSPEMLRDMALQYNFPFPILFDESQTVARAFTAACTPDFFLFDANARLAYHGRLDESTPGNGRPTTGKDLRAALNAVLQSQPAPALQLPSMGCSIKWASPKGT